MIPLIDLFSGCGGMTLGFCDARFGGAFRSVFALDHDPAAAASYAHNFGPHGRQGDVEYWASGREPVPSARVVIGGPPCQGFSLLNRGRRGDARRALWEPYMDIVEACGAEAFVIENVRWLLNSPEHAAIVRRAESMGFAVSSALLNAADYGVPQNRLRAFLLGIRGDTPPPFPPEPTHFPPAEGRAPAWRTVREAIGDLPAPLGVDCNAAPPPLDLHFGRRPTPKSLLRYKAVPPGGNRFDLQRTAPHLTPACWVRKTSGGTDLFGRLWWDRPSVTIRTEFFKPEKGRYLHPEKHRPITHREAARLMGFPDDFRFLGNKSDIARLIGNAVPPPLAGAVARHVAGLLG